MSKDYFYFNRTDRIVALILLAVIIITCLVRTPMSNPSDGEPVIIPADTTSVSENNPTVRPRSTRSYPKDSTRREYPKRETTRSTARYSRQNTHNSVDSVRKDTVRPDRYPRKQRPSAPVDLNAADSIMLISLPGIGPVFASRIIRYRQQLGGFTGTGQLLEINGLPDSLMEWFIITDTIPLRRIRINKETLNELRRHPYINFYQARSIVEFRRDRGNIKGPEQLTLFEEFTTQDLERLVPYLDFSVNQ